MTYPFNLTSITSLLTGVPTSLKAMIPVNLFASVMEWATWLKTYVPKAIALVIGHTTIAAVGVGVVASLFTLGFLEGHKSVPALRAELVIAYAAADAAKAQSARLVKERDEVRAELAKAVPKPTVSTPAPAVAPVKPHKAKATVKPVSFW